MRRAGGFENRILPDLKSAGAFDAFCLCLVNPDKQKDIAQKLLSQTDGRIPQLITFKAAAGDATHLTIVDRLVGPTSADQVKQFLHAPMPSACGPAAAAAPKHPQRRGRLATFLFHR